MAVFVVDPSVALAWCFEDEATNWTEEFLERLRQGDRIIVSAHWANEVANALLMGVRRKRIKPEPEQPQLLWDELGRLPIDTEPALTTARGKEVLALGEKHGLTVYDAAYLARARPPLPIAAGNPRWRFAQGSTSRGRPAAAVEILKEQGFYAD